MYILYTIFLFLCIYFYTHAPNTSGGTKLQPQLQCHKGKSAFKAMISLKIILTL